MKVVFLDMGIPYPLNTGGFLRSHHLLKGLVERHDVMYASMCCNGETAADWPMAADMGRAPMLVPTGLIDTLPRSEGPRPWWGLPRQVRWISRTEFWNRLDQLQAFRPDVVHVRTFAMVPYALELKARDPRVRVSLDSDNIESILKYRTIQGQSGMRLLSRWRMESYTEAARLHLYEQWLYPKVDRICVCSELDRRTVSRRAGRDHVQVIPNGVDLALFDDGPVEDGPPRLLYVGSMDYAPNEQAVSYFSEQIFPAIRSRVPDAEFWVVGRRPSEQIKQLEARPGIRIVGGVPDVRPYLRESSLFVAPLRAGGGTRLKILEALAARQAVVSTTVGAEGLDLADGRDLVLADEPGAFAERCVELLGDADRRRRLGASGRAAVEAQYDWTSIRRTFADYIEATSA